LLIQHIATVLSDGIGKLLLRNAGCASCTKGCSAPSVANKINKLNPKKAAGIRFLQQRHSIFHQLLPQKAEGNFVKSCIYIQEKGCKVTK
jgi:hypothetical protein